MCVVLTNWPVIYDEHGELTNAIGSFNSNNVPVDTAVDLQVGENDWEYKLKVPVF